MDNVCPILMIHKYMLMLLRWFVVIRQKNMQDIFLTRECIFLTRECIFLTRECIFLTRECIFLTRECIFKSKTTKLFVQISLMSCLMPNFRSISVKLAQK